jgi:hypothetical protein
MAHSGDAAAGLRHATWQHESRQLRTDPYQIGGVFAGCRLSAWEIIKANPVLIPATR